MPEDSCLDDVPRSTKGFSAYDTLDLKRLECLRVYADKVVHVLVI